MIDKEKVADLVKSYFPEADSQTDLRLVEEIISTVTPIIYSLARQLVSQEREAKYFSKKRN